MKRLTGSQILSWGLQATAAVLLAQTLFFKFSAAKESVYIFSTLGQDLGLPLEPWGRIGSGVFELIAAVLLMIPSTVIYGALISLGVISGAIVSHIFWIGISLTPVNDHGELFMLAVIVFVSSLGVLFLRRRELAGILPARRAVRLNAARH
jgi:hypothetical protein